MNVKVASPVVDAVARQAMDAKYWPGSFDAPDFALNDSFAIKQRFRLKARRKLEAALVAVAAE